MNSSNLQKLLPSPVRLECIDVLLFEGEFFLALVTYLLLVSESTSTHEEVN